MIYFLIILAFSAQFVGTAYGSKPLLEQKNCRFLPVNGSREDHVLAPWTIRLVKCPLTGITAVAECDTECRNPLTGEQLPTDQYRPESVTFEAYLVHMDGSGIREYEIPVACKCIRIEEEPSRPQLPTRNSLALKIYGSQLRKLFSTQR